MLNPVSRPRRGHAAERAAHVDQVHGHNCTMLGSCDFGEFPEHRGGVPGHLRRYI
jgi:hypothetical protein